MPFDVRRGTDRARTSADGVQSWHAFSTGRHYDPGNTCFGLLLLHDEHLLAPGSGFPAHRHRDVEVVTWVLEGALTHEDSTGRRTQVRPGQVQVLSAGSGVQHSERNDTDRPVRFVQAWLAPATLGTPPAYALRQVDGDAGELVPVVPGRHAGALLLDTTAAALHVAVLQPGQAVRLPEAPYLHLHVARGDVTLDGAGRVAAGDAVRITGGGGPSLTAAADVEVLVWEMHETLGPDGSAGTVSARAPGSSAPTSAPVARLRPGLLP